MLIFSIIAYFVISVWFYFDGIFKWHYWVQIRSAAGRETAPFDWSDNFAMFMMALFWPLQVLVEVVINLYHNIFQ
jgi:hypothetical protein